MGRPAGRWVDSDAFRIYDVLWADRGWVLIDTIEAQTGIRRDMIKQTLHRGKRSGDVDGRLANRNPIYERFHPFQKNAGDQRWEWRITPKGIERMSNALEPDRHYQIRSYRNRDRKRVAA